jgi:DNA-binding response OmpR family regulator
MDDEEEIRSIIRRALTMAGHEVVEAGNGAEGTRLFEASPFDLVITDLLMPEKEGIETILELREDHPDLRILVVSGGMVGDRDGPLADAVSLGADAAVAKPFTVAELLEAVEGLLARA